MNNVTWKSFELDPNAPTEPKADIYDTLAIKYDLSGAQPADVFVNTLTKFEQES